MKFVYIYVNYMYVITRKKLQLIVYLFVAIKGMTIVTLIILAFTTESVTIPTQVFPVCAHRSTPESFVEASIKTRSWPDT